MRADPIHLKLGANMLRRIRLGGILERGPAGFLSVKRDPHPAVISKASLNDFFPVRTEYLRQQAHIKGLLTLIPHSRGSIGPSIHQEALPRRCHHAMYTSGNLL